MKRRRCRSYSTPKYSIEVYCLYANLIDIMLQFPEDIARRYVLLLDPMLGEKPDLLICASRLLQSL